MGIGLGAEFRFDISITIHKRKMINWASSNSLKFCFAKDPVKRKKVTGIKYFQTTYLDQVLVSRMYKDLSKLNTKNTI